MRVVRSIEPGALTEHVETISEFQGTERVVGLAIGLVGAFMATRIMQTLLYGVEPHDLGTFTLVTLMMAAVGILACWIPALRAARIDPAIAMRT